MSKCGGTFAEKLIKYAIAPGRQRFVKDSHIFHENWREPPNFVVGVMRNPCAIYLSRAGWKPHALQGMRGPLDSGPVVDLPQNFTPGQLKPPTS
eukprot:2063740-Amphidinium_carterae.1